MTLIALHLKIFHASLYLFLLEDPFTSQTLQTFFNFHVGYSRKGNCKFKTTTIIIFVIIIIIFTIIQPMVDTDFGRTPHS